MSLDDHLIELDQFNYITTRNLLEHTILIASPGAGKSSILFKLARRFLEQGHGAVFFTVKPGDCRFYIEAAARAGRRNDVIEVGPGRHSCNVLQYATSLTQAGGTALAITKLIEDASKLAGSASNKEELYWQKLRHRTIFSMLLLLKHSAGIDAGNIVEFIRSMARDPAQYTDQQWRFTSKAARWMAMANRSATTPQEKFDVSEAIAFMREEFCPLHMKQRTTCQMDVITAVDPLRRETIGEVLCCDTTVTPQAVFDDRKILIFDLPTSIYGPVGCLAAKVFKSALYMAAAQRQAVDATPDPVMVVCDECQESLGDELRIAPLARSAGVALMYATQSLTSLTRAFGSDVDAKNFVAQFSNIFYLSNLDTATTSHASKQCGHHKEDYSSIGFGEKAREFHGSFSEQSKPAVPESEFAILRRGGPANDMCVDAYLVRAGGFATADPQVKHPYLKATFEQEEVMTP